MEPWQIGNLVIGLVSTGLGSVLRARALWVARRVYRTAYWRGSSVDEVAKVLRAMGWALIGVGLLGALLALLGVQMPSLRG